MPLKHHLGVLHLLAVAALAGQLSAQLLDVDLGLAGPLHQYHGLSLLLLKFSHQSSDPGVESPLLIQGHGALGPGVAELLSQLIPLGLSCSSCPLGRGTILLRLKMSLS